jgi:hypothetical protein
MDVRDENPTTTETGKKRTPRLFELVCHDERPFCAWFRFAVGAPFDFLTPAVSAAWHRHRALYEARRSSCCRSDPTPTVGAASPAGAAPARTSATPCSTKPHAQGEKIAMGSPRPPRPDGIVWYCRACRRALNIYTSPSGQVTYRHSVQGRDLGDHPPEPVPLSEVPDAVMECDFCSRPHPAWAYVCEDQRNDSRVVTTRIVSARDYRDRHRAARTLRTETGPGLSHLWGERWAACDGCAALIERRDTCTGSSPAPSRQCPRTSHEASAWCAYLVTRADAPGHRQP